MIPAQRTMPTRPDAARNERNKRWHRPTWRDPRLAGGLVLVGASVALGAWAVDAAASTEQVYVLARDVAPGTDLTADGVLEVVDAHPGTDAYITAGSLPNTAIATRPLSKGELLPSSAVGASTDQDLRPVVLEVSTGLPAGTSIGDGVELWILPSGPAAADAEPAVARLVAKDLIVAGVGDKGTSLLDGSTTQVEVRVPAESLEAVLTAVGEGGQLVLVPTGQGQ